MRQRRSHEAELREIDYSGNGNDGDQKRPFEIAEAVLIGDKSADHGYVLSPQLREVVKSFGGLCPVFGPVMGEALGAIATLERKPRRSGASGPPGAVRADP